MSLKIRVYSDFVCPFCYIGEKPLMEAIEGKDVELEWMPFELRPEPVEPLSPNSDYIQTVWQQSVKPLSARFGVNMELPDIDPIPRTHLAHEGYQYAKEQGKALEYVKAVFSAYWQEGKNISDIAVLSEAAEKIGLNKEEFRAALETRRYKDVHQQALRHAYEEANVTAVPTFIIGSRMLRGLHTKEMIEKIILEQTESAEDVIGKSCSIDRC
ncbi:DsbA family oxidoreductase [Bacillus alveayuensis]|jgi:predicted DsbA family dithiol-disulfide isomerase|uniref:DsbA family oxidoreductase n=1 Tax=Aeribacillus alveayuensis TaxID=279215 RepID=UPI0005CD2532|nr:DsbA family oxidoreductase [Bacillus alveayuensis]